MSISYDIIKKHNGIINLYSDEIKGTCFEIVLPVKKSNEKYKVLIVDDSKTIRKLISLNLETTNRFTVYEAADAFEAELLFNELIPQVILLDIMMPGVDGMELCRKLRAEFFDRKIAIICITSSAIPDEKLMSAGFDSILRKPFGLDQLQNEIEKFL